MIKRSFEIFLDNLLLAIIYYLAGHVSMLFLSSPPTNAAVIWPPAGISLAAVLLKGYRVLPAIFIADLIIAIEVFGFNELISISFSLAVGLQAMLSAWIGVNLIHRFVGAHNPLIENKYIIWFLFLGGPVALFLPSALALCVEYYLGIVESSDLYYGFFTWWAGGAIGVAIFSPIVLVLFNRPQYNSRIVSVAVPLMVLFVLIVWFFNYTKTTEQQRLEHTFEQQVEALHAKTVIKLDNLRNELDTLKFYIESTDQLDQMKFSLFSQHRRKQYPEISALAWVPHVADYSGRVGLAPSMLDDKAIELIADKMFLSKQVKQSLPIHLIDPIDEFQAIIGLDIESYPQWKAGLEKSKDTEEAQLILPIKLSLDDGEKEMTVMVLPVFKKSLGSKKTDLQAKALKGYVLLFLPFHHVMNDLIAHAKDQKINLKIVGLRGAERQISGSLDKNHYHFEVLKKIEHFGSEINFNYFPDSDFVLSHSSLSIRWMLLIGLGVTGLFGFTLLSVTGQTLQTQRLVDQRTEDLSAERQFLKTLIDSIQEGIVACDKKGRLTISNSAAERIYGKDLGKTEPESWGECFELRDLEGNKLFNKGINPLRKLLKAPSIHDFEFSMVSADKSRRIVKANNAQVINDCNEVIGAVVSFQDVTIQKQTINELKKLSWAVEYCPSAIMITNNKGIIEYINAKFSEVTGYKQSDVIGKTPRILDSGKSSDLAFKNLWNQLLSGNEWRGEFYNMKKDGGFYWARQLIAPIANELQQVTHFVSIQEDITKEKQAAEVLSHQASHDELTGLLNRRECEKRLGQIILSAQIQDSKHVFCFLDLDNFKIVNDTCGHLAGDYLLREVCALFKGLLRGRDTLARLGGDEFGIIIEHCSLSQAKVLTEKICSFIEFYDFIWEGKQFNIGVSIGLTSIDGDSLNFTQVLSQADEACYMAKKAGRGQVCIFTQIHT